MSILDEKTEVLNVIHGNTLLVGRAKFKCSHIWLQIRALFSCSARSHNGPATPMYWKIPKFSHRRGEISIPSIS